FILKVRVRPRKQDLFIKKASSGSTRKKIYIKLLATTLLLWGSKFWLSKVKHILHYNVSSINGNVEFSGSKVADITPEQQWTLGQPGEGYIAKQPNAYMGLSSNSKVSVGTLSTIWINENTIFLMDDEAQLTSDTWSSMHIYGRFNLGKKAIFGGGRYTHFATYSNRTVSFGDRCQENGQSQGLLNVQHDSSLHQA
uniref:Uncharacterized protein n=1 Tax=Romanomermis culicivorax TaxID=13658 RepID=A0A915IN95_ROMCU